MVWPISNIEFRHYLITCLHPNLKFGAITEIPLPVVKILVNKHIYQYQLYYSRQYIDSF